MRKISLTEAKSRFKFCVVNDVPALVEISSLINGEVKSNKVFVCAPFLIGYAKTDIQIIPDPVVKDQELKDKFCSVFPPFELDKILGKNYGDHASDAFAYSVLEKIKKVEKSNTLKMLDDRAGEIKIAISLLQNICYNLSKEAGWHDNPREDGTMIALIHSEISEALEGIRKNLNDDHLPSRKMVEVELADAIIRIMDYAGYRGLDVAGAIVEKLEYNQQRQDHKKENRNKEGGKKF